VKPNFTRRTDRRVEIRAHQNRESTYSVDVEGGPTFGAAIINIGGRASALSVPTTLELGGGDTEVVIEGYDDERADDGCLLAVGFAADAIL
jgi:hypothetical protein